MVSGVGSDRGLEGANDVMALAVAGSKQLPFVFEFLMSTGSHVACSQIEQELSLTLLELKSKTKQNTGHDTTLYFFAPSSVVC